MKCEKLRFAHGGIACDREATFVVDDRFIATNHRCARHAASAVRCGFDVTRLSNGERIPGSVADIRAEGVES